MFEVSGVHHNGLEDAKLLEYAALAECSSSHPISKSLQKAYGKNIDRSRVTEIEEISGNGVTAKVDGIAVAAGNEKLMEKTGNCIQILQSCRNSCAYGCGRQIRRTYSDSDTVKPHAKTGD